MNELYYTPVESKDKVKIISNEVKKITNSDIANSVFVSVFQNIKFYIKEIRNILLKKLRDLDIIQDEDFIEDPSRMYLRRHSANCLYDSQDGCKEILLTVRNNSNYKGGLKSFYGSEDNYIEFLNYLDRVYKSISEIFGNGPEAICHQLLSLCQSNVVIAEYDVHKSLFYDYILNDRVISVVYSCNL